MIEGSYQFCSEVYFIDYGIPYFAAWCTMDYCVHMECCIHVDYGIRVDCGVLDYIYIVHGRARCCPIAAHNTTYIAQYVGWE